MFKSRTLLIVTSLALLLSLFANRSSVPVTPALAAGPAFTGRRTALPSNAA